MLPQLTHEEGDALCGMREKTDVERERETKVVGRVGVVQVEERWEMEKKREEKKMKTVRGQGLRGGEQKEREEGEVKGERKEEQEAS